MKCISLGYDSSTQRLALTGTWCTASWRQSLDSAANRDAPMARLHKRWPLTANETKLVLVPGYGRAFSVMSLGG